MRAVRLKCGLSQQVLAEAGSISFQQIQKYERGEARISAVMVCRLAERLGVSPMALLPDNQHTAEGAVVLRSRDVAEALRILDRMAPPETRRALQMLKLLAGEER